MVGGSLKLTDTSKVNLTEVPKREDNFPAVMASIKILGLELPSLPQNGFKGEMPDDITFLDDNALGKLLSDMSSFLGYVQTQLSIAELDMKTDNDVFEHTSAQLRIQLKNDHETYSGKLTTKDKDDLLEINQLYQGAKNRMRFSEAKYILMKTMYETKERDWNTVSRRITQMGQQVDRAKRDVNVSNIPSQFKGFSRRGHT